MSFFLILLILKKLIDKKIICITLLAFAKKPPHLPNPLSFIPSIELAISPYVQMANFETLKWDSLKFKYIHLSKLSFSSVCTPFDKKKYEANAFDYIPEVAEMEGQIDRPAI